MKRRVKAPPAAESGKRKPTGPVNEYRGYSGGVDTIAAFPEASGVFFNKYIAPRKPVKISSGSPVDLARFKLEEIVETLGYVGSLQVERKHVHGFGLGQVREEMSFADIVAKIRGGDDSYYLTTQYEKEEEIGGIGESIEGNAESGKWRGEESEESEDEIDGAIGGADRERHHDDEEDEGEDGEDEGAFSDTSSFDMENLQDDFDEALSEEEDEEELRVRSLLQPPLTLAAAILPITPEPFAPLVTQQINLWMGTQKTQPEPANIEEAGRWVPNGNSSGLHHDHADNLYVLVEGKKRFTLYLPKDAHKLFTVGEIQKVFPNGLIDYKMNERARFWRRMREDGAIEAELARWRLENEDFSEFSRAELLQIIEDDENHIPAAASISPPISASNSEHESASKLVPAAADVPAQECRLDPPSFLTVPPLFAHLDELSKDPATLQRLENYANVHFPGFLQLQKTEVWLYPGEMLYIPCGWFHEVTSYASGGAHVALNWWFVPPSGTTPDAAYADDYWVQDFARTMAAVQKAVAGPEITLQRAGAKN